MFNLEKIVAGIQTRITITHIEMTDLCIIHLILKRNYPSKTQPDFSIIMHSDKGSRRIASFGTPELKLGEISRQSKTVPFTKDMLEANWEAQVHMKKPMRA